MKLPALHLAGAAMLTAAHAPHLFDEMRDGKKDYRLFGHAAGAQFVHRLMLLRADNRASLAVVANAGWYAVPEWRKDKKPPDWPLSLLGTPAGEADVRAAPGKRLVVMLGEADTADDASVEKGGDVAKQGGNPVERGENFLAWQKPKRAIAEFQRALSRNPAFVQAGLGLGRAHFLLGQDEQAALALQVALNLNPQDYRAHLALAKVYWRQNQLEQANREA